MKSPRTPRQSRCGTRGDSRRDRDHRTGPAYPLQAIEFKMQFAMQDMKGLFLFLVILLGMFLARQNDDQLLAIMAVDDGHHRDAEFVEPLDAVMVRNLQLRLAGNDAPALVKQILDPLTMDRTFPRTSLRSVFPSVTAAWAAISCVSRRDYISTSHWR